jgi:uncharacterized membrane protein
VAGVSYTNGNPESITGVPEVHPFLWHNGKMTDLGSFAGAGIPFFTTSINGMNNRGQVIGALPLPGDQTLEPFIWDGTKLIDMATQSIGGSFFDANVINDAGVVAGGAVFPNRPNDAALPPPEAQKSTSRVSRPQNQIQECLQKICGPPLHLLSKSLHAHPLAYASSRSRNILSVIRVS